MPVYVDDYRAKFRNMVMSHLFADTLDELHAMADKIGVARRWFQNKPGNPHYDICESKRTLAIAAGTTPVSIRYYGEFQGEGHTRRRVNSPPTQTKELSNMPNFSKETLKKDAANNPQPPDMTAPTKGFRPPFPMRERFCAYGGDGVGKTSALLDIIKLNKLTGGDAVLYMIQSDYGSMERMLNAPTSRFTMIRDRVRIFQVEDWPSYVDALDEIRGIARPHDWVGVDCITDAWEAVQRFYTHEVRGETPESFFLEKKKRYEARKAELIRAGKAGEVKGEGNDNDGTDWKIIKGMYDPWWNRLYGRLCSHIFLIARERDVRDTFHPDKRATQDVYKASGSGGSKPVLPKGEGKIAFGPDTVAHFTKDGGGKFWLSTYKDRERELLRNVNLEKGFARVYLHEVAGWVLR